MESSKIRRGDTVMVITGKDKGRKGKVLAVNPEEQTLVVDGINMVVKHKKSRGAQQKSAREKKAGNIHISNVAVLCKCGKPTRVGYKFIGEKKARVCKKCGEVLDRKFTRAKEKVKEVEVEDKKVDEKQDKQPLKRREVKSTADSKVVKKPDAKPSVSSPRKVGGS